MVMKYILKENEHSTNPSLPGIRLVMSHLKTPEAWLGENGTERSTVVGLFASKTPIPGLALTGDPFSPQDTISGGNAVSSEIRVTIGGLKDVMLH